MATIELRQVEKKFGELHAVKPVDLTIRDGEFVVLLGPSGCGKTTTLRMIAGLETVTDGDILLNGKNVTNLRGRERDIAFVFQLFALYPHMSVRQNVAFPLQAQGSSREEIDQRVSEVVKMLNIEALLTLRPGSLSGGDRQRVALARALVRRPAAFLMDEPLGALDAEFREVMRAEIKGLHLSQHATTVYVTHDQIEAMAMGDRIVVMSNAVVQQIGTPQEVYHNPTNLFVARFIGSPGMNLLAGRHDGWRGGAAGRQSLLAAGRVAQCAATGRSDPRVPARGGESFAKRCDCRPNLFRDLHGAYTMLHMAIGGDDLIINARVPRELTYAIDTLVRVDLDPMMVRFFDPKSEAAIKG